MRLLCVEDDFHVTEGLITLCEMQGIDCDTAPNGIEGLKKALNDVYDIIVLDIMLPRIDGFEVLSQLRKRGINTPVIILTARGTTEDKVKSLELGADDYMVKPIRASELFARIKAILRRHDESINTNNNSIKYGNLEFYPFTNSVEINGETIRLTQKEARILEVLMKRPENLIKKEKIIQNVWGVDEGLNKNSLEIYIYKLRKKIKDANVKISTVRKLGYVLESDNV